MTAREAAIELAHRLSALATAIAEAIEGNDIPPAFLTRAVEHAKRLDVECRDLILRARCGRGECAGCHADLGPREWLAVGQVTHGLCPPCLEAARKDVDAMRAARRGSVSSPPCANGRSAKP